MEAAGVSVIARSQKMRASVVALTGWGRGGVTGVAARVSIECSMRFASWCRSVVVLGAAGGVPLPVAGAASGLLLRFSVPSSAVASVVSWSEVVDVPCPALAAGDDVVHRWSERVAST